MCQEQTSRTGRDGRTTNIGELRIRARGHVVGIGQTFEAAFETFDAGMLIAADRLWRKRVQAGGNPCRQR